MTSIKLYRGEFGHLSLLNAASDLVTHAHPEAHIIVWLGGTPGVIQVGDTAIRPGPDIAIGVNSFEPHSHSFAAGAEPGCFLAFYIDPDWASERYGLAPGAPLFRRSSIALSDWLRTQCTTLFDGATDAEFYGLGTYEVERLIDCLVEGASVLRSGSITPAWVDFRLRKAVALMRSNVSGRMTLDEIARSVGLSRPHFFALFKAQMNLTPNVYWNALRMEEALRQVESSDESLTSVACNLGFTTQGNFTRFFRDHAGVPPTLYREASRTVA